MNKNIFTTGPGGDVPNKKYNVVFVLGPPGSGKGTQCSNIQKDFGLVHLSAGDLLRVERERKGSTFGELIEGHIQNGTIVPVEITCKLLENAMEAQRESIGFLVDGFPRNYNNLEGWEKAMNNKVLVHFVLYLSAPLNICVQRCLDRSQGRSDDNKESIEKRIVTYNNQTLPIIQYYASLNMVKEIDGTREPKQFGETSRGDASIRGFTVYADIENVFNQANFLKIT